MDAKVPGLSDERPLQGSALLVLMASSVGAVILLYLLVGIFLTVLLIAMAAELLLLLALARFGLAGWMGGILGQHSEILLTCGRSLLLRKEVGAHVSVGPTEAPGLFEILHDLSARAKVLAPEEVSIELSTNAWVRLPGFRRGGHGTQLGIGFDLMAGLTENEIKGILAHEISHARLVQRGVKRWVANGLSRAGKLANGLFTLRERFIRAKRASGVCAMAFRVADQLARVIARLFAAFSRQDEYAADRGAAELCGADSLRSSLLKMESLNRKAARLPWAERMARLQSEGGFSRWLIHELTSTTTQPEGHESNALFDAYATHPTLINRLAALPHPLPNSRDLSAPGLALLQDADGIAERLLAEIQRIQAMQEEKDEAGLRRWIRSTRRGVHLTAVQGVGSVLLVCGLGALPIVALADALTWQIGLGFIFAIIVGVILYRVGARRERLQLPIPEYAAIKASVRSQASFTAEALKALEAEVKGAANEAKPGRKRAGQFAQQAFQALESCSYLRAWVASSFCLQENKESKEGHLAFAIATAGRREAQLSADALNYLRGTVDITRGSWAWGTAWALVLLGDYTHAEAVLLSLLKSPSPHPTFLALQALCQAERGKIQSAVIALRKAVAARPEDEALRGFLVELLISAGFLREALAHLGSPESSFARSPEMAFAQLRLRLLMQDYEPVEKWTEHLLQMDPVHGNLIRLGALFEQARQESRAEEYYQKALSLGHCPEARLGLARLSVLKSDPTAAREQLRLALDMLTPAIPGSSGTAHLFGTILAQWRSLEQPIPRCKAWIATVIERGAPEVVGGLRVLIFAADSDNARERMDALLAALRPHQPPLLPDQITWVEAPAEAQPDRPTVPGVVPG